MDSLSAEEETHNPITQLSLSYSKAPHHNSSHISSFKSQPSRRELVWIICININQIPLSTLGILALPRHLRQVVNSYLNDGQLVPQTAYKGLKKENGQILQEVRLFFLIFFPLKNKTILIQGFPKSILDTIKSPRFTKNDLLDLWGLLSNTGSSKYFICSFFFLPQHRYSLGK